MNVFIFIGLLVGLFVGRIVVRLLITFTLSLNEFSFNSATGYFLIKLLLFTITIISFAGLFFFGGFVLSWSVDFLLNYKINIFTSIGIIFLLRSILFINGAKVERD